MGYLISFLVGVLSAVSSQHQKDSKHDSDHTEPPQVIFHPEDIRQYRRHQEQQSAMQKSLKRATWATFWAVLIYAGVTLAIYRATKNSADAAEKAANTAHDTLVVTNRAWVGQSGPIWLKFFQGANNQPAVEIHLSLENFGHSPAVSVGALAELVEFKDVAQASVQSCNFARTMVGIKLPGYLSSDTLIPPTGQTIFPQEKFTSTIKAGPVRSRNVTLYAVGCIVYRDGLTKGTWWTKFCQETPWLASSYRDGDPLVVCNVNNEVGEYEP